MVSYRIEIPEEAYEGLEKLAALGNDDFRTLFDALKETVPTFHLDEFSAHVSSRVDLASDVISDIIEFILPLYALRFDMGISIPEFVDSILASVEKTQSEDLELSVDSIALLRDRISEILTLDHSLGIVAKSRYIAGQHERLFIETRIFTELRPIFQDDASKPPTAGFILHKLRINYFESGRSREFFVTMDATDIEKLRQALSRADQKAESLRLLLNTTPMKILEIKSNE